MAKPDQPSFWERRFEFKASPTTITAAQLAQLKAARQALADCPAPPKEEQEAMQFQQVYLGPTKSTTPRSTRPGRQQHGPPPRRLPRGLAAEGRLPGTPSCPPRRSTRAQEVYNVETRARDGVIIVALSQMWATLDHPDPDGEQLRDVARFLRWLQEAENGHKGKLVAVMWDWASLYQDKPEGSRSYEQTAMFNAGQRSMNLWYCHPRTITLMNRKTPAGRRNGYNISGWPVS